MGKLSFYRAFHMALAVVCFLLHWLICVAQETAEYYEDQYSVGVRYSKFLVLLRFVFAVQSVFALEAFLPTFWSRRERDQIPAPQLRLLLKHFLSKYSERNVRMIITACSYLFFLEWLGRDRDGVVKGGIPFLVVFTAVIVCRFVYLVRHLWDLICTTKILVSFHQLLLVLVLRKNGDSTYSSYFHFKCMWMFECDVDACMVTVW